MFTPAGATLTSVRYRLQKELGGRRSFFDSDYQRYVAGVNGDFNIKDNAFISRFGYDAGFVYEDYQQQRIDTGDARRSLIRQGIAGTLIPGVFFNPFIGQNAPLTGFAPFCAVPSDACKTLLMGLWTELVRGLAHIICLARPRHASWITT